MRKLPLSLSLARVPCLQQVRTCTGTTAPVEHAWAKPANGFDTGIRVYNCFAKRKVQLVLPNPHYVSWYTCGPTVYDAAHLGHASCYVKLDIIQRILREYFNLNLVTAMNVTDIDDKIIRRSQEGAGRDWRELARGYEADFWRDLKRLNVVEPNLKIRVTDNIPQIIAFIENILAKDAAYVGSDKSVYFDVLKFPIYGKLQKLTLSDVKSEDPHKLSLADFALWKAQKSPAEPSWPSPWGDGRPGWHIECSTLASIIFGNSVDFHAGGLDLKFPHHENEEAQCCVFHNTPQWVNYWLHTGHLNVKGQAEKMSKSLKNTISIEEMLSNYSADDFRMACVLSNYRNPVEYSEDVMETARAVVNKFKAFRSDCQAYLMGKKSDAKLDPNQILDSLHYAKAEVDACFKDDFDTARSMSVLLDQISGISRNINTATNSGMELTTATCLDTVAAAENFVLQTLRTFGFMFVQDPASGKMLSEESEINLNRLLEGLLQSRKSIRDRAVAAKSKELFQICDELRNCLKEHGIEVKDHSQGSSWSFITNNKK